MWILYEIAEYTLSSTGGILTTEDNREFLRHIEEMCHAGVRPTLDKYGYKCTYERDRSCKLTACRFRSAFRARFLLVCAATSLGGALAVGAECDGDGDACARYVLAWYRKFRRCSVSRFCTASSAPACARCFFAISDRVGVSGKCRSWTAFGRLLT